jgi:hypothetical protein
MIDFKPNQVRRHRQNIERYCRPLATELTDLERRHSRAADQRDEVAASSILPGTRCASLAHAQDAPKVPAGPWEMF